MDWPWNSWSWHQLFEVSDQIRAPIVIDDDDDDDDDNFDDEYDDDYDDDAPWQIILREQTLFLDVRLPLNLK